MAQDCTDLSGGCHEKVILSRLEVFDRDALIEVRKGDGALGGIRTPDRLVRSQELYPAELPAQRKLIMFPGAICVNFGYLFFHSWVLRSLFCCEVLHVVGLDEKLQVHT